MWVQDTSRNAVSDIDLMNQARAMRDEAVARYLSMAWHGLANATARLLHVGAGQPHTN
jgi:hypothetical protein